MAWQPTDWFKTVFGFEEQSPEAVRAHLELAAAADADGVVLHAPATGRCWYVGVFDTPTLQELRALVTAAPAPDETLGALAFTNIQGDVRDLIRDRRLAGAVFQVASQFNCLEMRGPSVTPSAGVTAYALDQTQGPACALACPAATVFRNYFVNGTGQCAPAKQLDTLADVAQLVGNRAHRFWAMRNGYCLPTSAHAAVALAAQLQTRADAVVAAVGVGVHWETEVVGGSHRVAQVLCSALPVAYSGDALDSDAAKQAWGAFGKLVLTAAFKCTLAVGAVLARRRRERVLVFLTPLGAGAFGNPLHWVREAVTSALAEFAAEPLEVCMVHFGDIPVDVVPDSRPH